MIAQKGNISYPTMKYELNHSGIGGFIVYGNGERKEEECKRKDKG
jgi:hypothetical protein